MAGCLVLPPFLGLMLPMFPGLLLLARGLPALVLGTLLPPERVDGIDTPVPDGALRELGTCESAGPPALPATVFRPLFNIVSPRLSMAERGRPGRRALGAAGLETVHRRDGYTERDRDAPHARRDEGALAHG